MTSAMSLQQWQQLANNELVLYCVFFPIIYHIIFPIICCTVTVLLLLSKLSFIHPLHENHQYLHEILLLNKLIFYI